MDVQLQKRDELIAFTLGITADELEQTEWSLDEMTTKDGAAALLVKFREGSPRHILEKIKGLDQNNTVRVDPNALVDVYEKEDGDDENEFEVGGES